MTDDEMIKQYIYQREEMKNHLTDKYSANVQIISNTLAKSDYYLTDENFEFSDPVGLTIRFDDLLSCLAPDLKRDKDDLIKWEQLIELYEIKNNDGYFYKDNYMLMLSPLLRRGMHPANNWAPSFVNKLWKLDCKGLQLSVALDYDRIKVDVNDHGYLEFDTWFGAPFESNIANIKDGISKLRPPMDLDSDFINIIFNEKYSLDVKWNTKGSIKTFQALEFSNEKIVVEFQGETFHPVKYVHAEFDLKSNLFRHFDGAIHFYTHTEYMERRESDFNYTNKSTKPIKAKSQKIFKLDGKINKEVWVDLTGHFLTGNPLIIEYFTGQYPQYIIDKLTQIRSNIYDL